MPIHEPLMLGLEWMELGHWLDVFGAALLWVGLLVIFIECGLLFPFLPGDTLLFSIGLFIATGEVDVLPLGAGWELVVAMTLMVLAAFAGNVVGYEIGRKVGPPLYQRDGRLLRRRRFDQTSDFFDRHGSAALVIGRFVAFVRTFVTVVAGATGMDRRRYLLWSFVGAVLWVLSITMLGFFLGASVPGLGNNLELALLLIMAFFTLPLVWEWWRHRRQPTVVGPVGPVGPATVGPATAGPAAVGAASVEPGVEPATISPAEPPLPRG